MLELLNSAACLVLMVYSLPVAMVLGNRGMWLERITMVSVQIGLFMRLVNPWVGWAPPITWSEAYLTIAAAIMLVVWWRRVWIFARSYLSPQQDTLDRRRRRTDWGGAAAMIHREIR